MDFNLPILTCAEARLHEEKLFDGDASVAEAAMKQAGLTLGKHLAQDAQAFIEKEESPELILLLGKGHNTGDALYAAAAFCAAYPETRAILICCWNSNTWSDAVYRAFEQTQKAAHSIEVIDISSDNAWEPEVAEAIADCRCPIAVDGIFGMSFKPPMRGKPESLIGYINAHEQFRLRVAVDMPSGLAEGIDGQAHTVFQSDLTYATGILKSPVASAPADTVGRLRMIDLGFFENTSPDESSAVCSPRILERRPRDVLSDKRTFGHVFILAGSRQMPGALMMATAAAIRSGVGLVTVCAPESICGAAAAQHPEAMWLPAPETFEGFLSLPTLKIAREHIARASAVLVGPGMGRFEETQVLIETLIRETEDIPLILDADALQPRPIEVAAETRDLRPATILTPHAGELARISSGNATAIFG